MKKTIFSAIVITFLSFVSFQYVFAIGMITKPIVIKDILRGQETLTTLTLLNSEEKEATYGLKAEGQVATWVSFYRTEDKDLKNPITEIEMPMGNFVDVKTRISIPKDMPNGKYNGKILVFLTSGGQIQNDQASVNVSQQISRDLTITVTDKEIIQLKAAFIPATYDVLQGKPLTIRVLYENQGNVNVKPDLNLKITKAGTTVYNVIFPYPEGEEAVRAYASKEISPVEWQTVGQGKGNYRAEFKVFLNNEEVQLESFNFSIGYSDVSFLSALSLLWNNNLTAIWILIGAIPVVLIVILVMLNKKRRKL